MSRQREPSETVARVGRIGAGASGASWALREGDILTFGRSQACDITLDSPYTSRQAGTLQAGTHFIAVTRSPSDRGPSFGRIWIHSFDAFGPLLIRPGGTVAVDTPSAEIHLTTNDPEGRWNAYEARTNALYGTPVLRLHLHTALRDAVDDPGGSQPILEPTLPTLAKWRAREHHVVLVALTAPLFDVVAHNGQLPSNGDIASRLTQAGHPQAEGTVRNRLHEWKRELGLGGGPAAAVSHYQLVLLAKETGLVTQDDVDALADQERAGGLER